MITANERRELEMRLLEEISHEKLFSFKRFMKVIALEGLLSR